MPVNLLSIAVTWLAGHLVAFSLLGFLIAGLFVFGMIDTPRFLLADEAQNISGTAKPYTDAGSAAVGGSPSTTTGLDQSPSEALKPEQAGTTEGGNGTTGTGGDPNRSPPRLIGGSLPIYGQPDRLQSPPRSIADDTFRPSIEEPGMGPIALTRNDYLQHARRAFWNGEFEMAEAAYMALISEYPADADAFGELGNLYESMGKPVRALDAYYEAGVRLKAAGETGKLKQIIELLTREGDARVDQLAP